MEIKKIITSLGIGLLLFTFIACVEEYEPPFNEVIPAEQSGLLGLWEGESLTKMFAKNILDSLGNVINDDKNRPIWLDTTSVKTRPEGFSEFIEFYISDNTNMFAAAPIDSISDETGHLVSQELPNMPITYGNWVALNTINPSGTIEDIRSVNLFDPQDRHNPLASMVWTIKSVTTDELIIEYSYGSSSYDTLFVKTFHKR